MPFPDMAHKKKMPAAMSAWFLRTRPRGAKFAKDREEI